MSDSSLTASETILTLFTKDAPCVVVESPQNIVAQRSDEEQQLENLSEPTMLNVGCL